uniref:Uncharacterized protein n=1 Tax=Rhizophora mucronata TaxID=61149 RepID=A0A2P2R3T6_RHIMU
MFSVSFLSVFMIGRKLGFLCKCDVFLLWWISSHPWFNVFGYSFLLFLL